MIAVFSAQAQTLDDKSAVSVKREFTIAVGYDSFPYQFAADGNKADGLLIDIWKLWAERNGYLISFKVADWTESLAMIENHQADFHAGIAITAQRQQRFILGQPIVPVQAGLFVHQQLRSLTNVSELAPYVVGAVNNSSHVTLLPKLVPGVQIKTFNSRADLFTAAAQGQIKVFAGMSRGTNSISEFSAIAKQFPMYKKFTYQTYDMTFATAQDNVALAEQIQQGLAKIVPEDILVLERKWLGLDAQSDALVIAVQSDMAPYMSISGEGEPIGLFIDIWRKWSERTGQEVVFISDSKALSMQHLQTKSADIHAAFADTAVNANLFPHAYHLYSIDSMVYYPLEEGVRPLNVKALTKARLGIFKDSPVYDKLLKRFPDVTLVKFDSLNSMLAAIKQQSIDGLVAPVEVMHLHLLKNSLQGKFASIEGIHFESKLYSLVRQDNKALIDQIRAGFAAIELDELRMMEKVWIPTAEARYFANQSAKVIFSDSQKQWLLRHPVIRLGALNNWPPVEFVDENGQFKGMTADLKGLLEKRAQINIEVQLFDEWSQLLAALQSNNIDMVASMEQTEDRAAFAVFTDSYWPQHWAIVTSSANSKVHSLKELAGKRLAVTKGYQLIPQIHRLFPQVLLQIVPDSNSGFAAVRQGKADAFIDGMISLATELKTGVHQDLSFNLVDDLEPAMERIGIRKDYEPLVGILNKVIMSITDDEKKVILEKWFELKIESGVNERKVLTFGLVFLVILSVVILWNWRLSSEVNLRREMEAKMKHMASHDELTQLPNRMLLRDRLSTAIATHARHQELLALLFIDLDGFKEVNDNHGHDVGDELLAQLADRFRISVRRSDTVSRFGGDEFVVLLTSLHNKDEAAEICQKLVTMINQPFTLSDCTVTVGASIGVAMYPEDGNNDTELMKTADTLMYQVKNKGKNGYWFNGDQAPTIL